MSVDDLIPESINGIATDVIEVPKMYAFSSCSSGKDLMSPSSYLANGCEGHSYDKSGKPYKCIPGGSSIGPSNQNIAGTLGFFALNKNKELVGVTNNHVMGTQVYDPSPPSINI